ncbi:hypothetical protein Tco_0255061 [Tanacetum coccineum]
MSNKKRPSKQEIRVVSEDKVKEIRKNGKRMKNVTEEIGEFNKDVNKGVFGTGANGNDYGVSSDVAEEECGSSPPQDINAGTLLDAEWVNELRLLNIPPEAWSVKGIRALSSRLGRPIKMDQVTTDMCRACFGRLGYARVMVEINAEGVFFEKIKINYVDDMKKNRKNFNNNKRMRNNDLQGNKQQQQGVKFAFKPKVPKANPVINKQKRNEQTEGSIGINTTPKIWNVGQDRVKELRKSANKYVVLSDDENKLQPTCDENKDWNYDMINYFKYQWEAMARQEKDNCDEEDVYENDNQAVNSFIADEILGDEYGGGKVQAERSRKFIAEENVQICAILETHLKTKSISKAFKLFYVLLKSSKTKVRIFVSFIYVANSCVDRRSLWTNLSMHKSIVNHKSMGDFNVTFKTEEHSNGTSNMTIDMNEFKDTVNNLEMEDLIMVNDEFLNQCEKAHGIFLPYLVSDHSQAIMTFPKGLIKKKKSFRFANYVADKEEFLDLVKEESIKIGLNPFDVKMVEEWKGTKSLLSLRTDMIKEVNNKEIKEALFDIDSLKAAGPKGYNSYFFKKAWNIIGTNICLAVREFLCLEEFWEK